MRGGMAGRTAILLSVLPAALSATLPRPAQAAGCRLHFGSLPRAAFIQPYDAFARKDHDTRFELTVRRRGGGCDFAVGADPGLSPGAGRGMTMGTGRLA